VGQLGQILVYYILHPTFSKHRFCVALDLSQGWISTLKIKDPFSGMAEIAVAYDGHQLVCSSCQSSSHSLSQWPVTKPILPARNSIPSHHPCGKSSHSNQPVFKPGPSPNPSGPHPISSSNSKHSNRDWYNRHSYRDNHHTHPKPVANDDGFTSVHHQQWDIVHKQPCTPTHQWQSWAQRQPQQNLEVPSPHTDRSLAPDHINHIPDHTRSKPSTSPLTGHQLYLSDSWITTASTGPSTER